VDCRAGLDGCGKSRSTGIRSPDRPADDDDDDDDDDDNNNYYNNNDYFYY